MRRSWIQGEDTSANHPYDYEINDHSGMKRVEVKGSRVALGKLM